MADGGRAWQATCRVADTLGYSLGATEPFATWRAVGRQQGVVRAAQRAGFSEVVHAILRDFDCDGREDLLLRGLRKTANAGPVNAALGLVFDWHAPPQRVVLFSPQDRDLEDLGIPVLLADLDGDGTLDIVVQRAKGQVSTVVYFTRESAFQEVRRGFLSAVPFENESPECWQKATPRVVATGSEQGLQLPTYTRFAVSATDCGFGLGKFLVFNSDLVLVR